MSRPTSELYGSLVVKRTFFDLGTDAALGAGRTSLTRRVRSDSMLFERYGGGDAEDVSEVPPAVGKLGSEEPSTAGESDHESVTGSGSWTPPGSAGSAVVEEALALRSGATTPELCEVNDLVAENTRLALENLALKQRFQEQQERQQQQQPQQPQPASDAVDAMGAAGMMWVPVGFPYDPMAGWADASCFNAACFWGQGQGWSSGSRAQASHERRRAEARRAREEDDGITDVKPEDRTTVMLRNMPNNYSQEMLLALLDAEGFAGQFDFLYLPVDFNTQAALGYAFINLVSPSVAAKFWETFDGFSRWAVPSRKVGFVTWSGPHQGLEAHVERYRNSPVMHSSVPDSYKPLVFEAGRRVEFPAPTKKPRVPRVRKSGRGY